MPDSRFARRLLCLRDFVNVTFLNLNRAVNVQNLFVVAVKREAVGVGENVNRLAPFNRVFANRLGKPVFQLDVEFLRGVLDNIDDMRGRQRLKINLCTARTQRGIYRRSITSRRSD